MVQRTPVWLAGAAIVLGALVLPAGHAQAQVACNGMPATIVGTPDDDTITGTRGIDVILALAGNDVVSGLAGNDTVCLGPGNDTLQGGTGDDVSVAEITVDGSDTFFGGDGADTVTYSARDIGVRITMDGVPNDGQVGEGDNTVGDVEHAIGGAGGDLITGNLLPNTLHGGAGHDNLNAVGGDSLFGGLGNDFLRVFSSSGTPQLSGDAGNDTLVGGSGDDHLIGGAGQDTLQGAAGNDTMQGDAGDDRLQGEAGNDILQGNEGNDRLNGQDGDDRLNGADGADRLTGDSGDDNLTGLAGDDLLDGGEGDDFLNGGNGNDTALTGLTIDGADFFLGGAGTDTADYSGRNHAASGLSMRVSPDGEVNDGLPGENDNVDTDVENAMGGTGRNILIGNSLPNVLIGGPSNDVIFTKDDTNGNDRAVGNAGTDTCTVDPGDNAVCETIQH
jgi:Ca2+-binding RTX toxin-like protein